MVETGKKETTLSVVFYDFCSNLRSGWECPVLTNRKSYVISARRNMETGKKRKRSSFESQTERHAGDGDAVPGSSDPRKVSSTINAVQMAVVDDSSADVLPKDVNVIAFAEKRSREIRTLLDSLGAKKTNKRIFQQLPRHMRRRAMSYNVKRLPKRLRAAAENEINRARKPKRPRHKYRKRGRNKTLLFARRQISKCWLETHVWHAKRFHMTEHWGYKLAHHANDKGVRATFRASNEHCLMSDMSYLECWEFRGKQEDLLEGLQKFTSSDIGRTFAHKDYLNSHLEGSCLLFEPSKYPLSAIGPVRFCWIPGTSQDRVLCIWTHPSVSAVFLSAVIHVFNLNPVQHMEVGTADEHPANSIDPNLGHAEKSDLASKTEEKDCSDGTVEYESAKCRMRLLKKDLVRFRLTGPECTAVLKTVLKPASMSSTEPGKNFWWNRNWDACDSVHENINEKQWDVWINMGSLPSATDVRTGSLLGLVVRDPRIFLPKKRVFGGKGIPFNPLGESSLAVSSSSRLPNRSLSLASSPIWIKEVRERVKREKMSDLEMNKLRSALSVPGLDLGDVEARVPIVLIRNGGYNQQENHSKLDYGAGWDIVVPPGWAMAFWISLVYNGARVAGLQEMTAVNRHRATFTFPFDFPDTAAGAKSAADKRSELQAKFLRYPPDKRPNYLKMGVLTPFHSPWTLLARDWMDIVKYSPTTDFTLQETSNDSFHVVRNLRLLSFLRKVLAGDLNVPGLVTTQSELIQMHACGLVAVHLSFQSGGTFEEFSTINLPSEEDYSLLTTFDGDGKGPTEPAHNDHFRKVVPPKQRRKLQVESILSDKDSVVDHCSRKLIGYTVSGGYSFIRGSEMAFGYCTLFGLLQLARITSKFGKNGVPVLVRHPHSLQYHFAQLSLLPFSSDL